MMMRDTSLLAGILIGFSIAVPLGPMGLLCIQRTLRSGMRIGVSTGLGAATVNVIYGALITLGLDKLMPWVSGSGRALSALSGVFLLWSALRTMRGTRLAADKIETAGRSSYAAYLSALLFNATNPLSPILIISLLSPIIGSISSRADELVLLLGMFGAAMTWWICLCGGIALLRSRLSPTSIDLVNRGAGMLLTIYGAVALARSAGL